MALLTTGARVSPTRHKVKRDGLDPVRILGSRERRQAAWLDGRVEFSLVWWGGGSCPREGLLLMCVKAGMCKPLFASREENVHKIQSTF